MKSNKNIYQSANKLEFYQILNNLKELCFSSYGKKKIDNFVFFFDEDILMSFLNMVSEMIECLTTIGLPNVQIYDIDEALRISKIKDAYLNSVDLLNVRLTLKSIRMLKIYFYDNKNQFPTIFQLSTKINNFKKIEDEILKVVDEQGSINPKASGKLKEIIVEMEDIHDRIEHKLQSMLRDTLYKHAVQEQIITKRQDRFVIPIKKDHKGKVPGIVLDVSNTGETLFIEPQSIVELNNKVITLKKERQIEEIRLLKRVTYYVYEKWEEISNSIFILSQLDEVYAKARYSINNNCTKPVLSNNKTIKIIQARHPLVDREKIVPVDIILGGQHDILILTGPNTGGKTVSLKTLGLLTLMTLVGMHIPAKQGSEIALVDDVFIDIGDEQSIEQDLSTFSSHISNIAQILKKATHKSLVLIDELGAGTDPREGGALSIAILEYLLSMKCLAWITTHLSDVKGYSLSKDRIETASCLFNVEYLLPEYKIIYGIVGNSNALVIAEKLNLCHDVVENARRILNNSTSGDEQLTNEVIRQKDKYISLLSKYEKLIEETEKLKDDLLIKERELLKREQDLLFREKETRKREISDSKKLVKDTRRQLLKLLQNAKNERSNRLDEKKIKQSFKQTEEINIDLDKKFSETISDEAMYSFSSQTECKIGDEVYVVPINKRGKIVDINTKKQEVAIMVGDVKLYANMTDIKLIINDNQSKYNSNLKKDMQPTISYNVEEENLPYELHLIGMRGEEAIDMCRKYIEALNVQGKEKGRIVHGVGQGILKTLVNELLKSHPYIESFYSPKDEKGGFGVTEIILKT